MGYIEFPEDWTFITPQLLRKRYGQFDPNVFKRWQDQGKVEKVRNGLYRRTAHEMRGELDRYSIAYQIYPPSYVSLHSALKYHGFIPETVFEVTSVSTRKTKMIEFRNTRYRYRQIKDDLFWGYREETWRGLTYWLATPEKALIDLAYMEPQFSERDWLEEMRFDEMELSDTIDWVKMMIYADRIKSDTLNKRIGLLLDVYDL
ncbi:MAG: hypothetical protein AAF741_06700 [Bacteroidota bacterium]